MAISGDIPAWPLMTRDRVCQATPKTLAPAGHAQVQRSKAGILDGMAPVRGVFHRHCSIPFLDRTAEFEGRPSASLGTAPGIGRRPEPVEGRKLCATRYPLE